MDLRGLFEVHLKLELSNEQQQEVKRYLISTTELCESISDFPMQIIKLTPLGLEVMRDYGSHEKYLLQLSANQKSEKRWENVRKANAFAELAKNYWWVPVLLLSLLAWLYTLGAS